MKERPNPEIIDTPTYYKYVMRAKQSPPYIQQLPYDTVTVKCSANESYPWVTPSWFYGELHSCLTYEPTRARNAAIGKVRDDLGNVTLLLEELAQARGLIKTIEQRAISLLKATKTLKKSLRYNFFVSSGVWKRNSKREERELASVPSAWLEWHFAYNPLIGSVKDLGEFLSNAEFSRRIKVSASCPFETHSGDPEASFTVHSGTYRVGLCGDVAVTNPNAPLAKSLNVASIAQSAWALVPWSWAADYLVNTSDVLANFDPYPGFTFGNWSESVKIEGKTTATFLDGLDHKTRLTGETKTYGRYLLQGPPLDEVRFELNPMLNTKRASYLLSAVAITMRGKLG